MIILDEATHTYTNTEKPKVVYKSVTTVLDIYKPIFDENFHSARVAEREGVSQQEILDRWAEITRIACEYGTTVHKIMENFLTAPYKLYSPRDSFEETVISAFRSLCEREKLTIIDNMVLSECRMSIEFNEERGIAGTADIIELIDDDLFNVWDFKTNKKFKYDNKYKEFFNFPLHKLMASGYNGYSLQNSAYAYMFEQQSGRKLNRSGVVYWDRETEAFKIIPTGYMRNEVDLLIQHYRNSQLN